MITVTPTLNRRGALVGGHVVQFADLQLSGTYATGGFAVTAAALGLLAIEDLIFMDSVGVRTNASPGAGYVPSWDRDTGYAKLFWASPTTGSQMDVFPYVKASINAADDVAGTTAYSTIAAVLGANYGLIVATATYVAAAPLTIAAQPDVPRNITVCHHNISGGTHTSVACDYVIVGKFNGATVTETLNLPAVSMANGTMILRSTYQVFDSITSITPSANPYAGTNWETICGIGSRIGLSQPLVTPAYGDVILASMQGTPVAITNVTDQTTGTVKATAGMQSMLFSTITANNNIVIKYNTGGGVKTAAGLAEITAATNVGTTTTGPTIRVMALGY